MNRIIITSFVVLAAITCGAAETAAPPALPPVRAAMVLMEEKKYEMAERMATAGLKSKNAKDALRARLIIAMARQGIGRYTEAIKAYNDYLDREKNEEQRDFAVGRRQECLELITMEGPILYERINRQEKSKLVSIKGSPVRISSEHFVVFAVNRDYALLVAKQAEAMLQRLSGQLPLGITKIRKPIEIHIWPDEKQFRDQNPDQDGSFSPYDNKNRIDLFQLDSMGKLSSISLDHVLPHEISHILLHEFIERGPKGRSRPLPLAINEGLSMTSERKVDNRRIVLVGRAFSDSKKRSIDLRRLLSITNYSQIDDLPLFYAESFSFVQFLRERLSLMQLGELLRQLRLGIDFETALRRAILMPDSDDFFQRLDSAWQKYAILQEQILRFISD